MEILSKEQVPSVPLNYSTGSREASITLGVINTLGTPLNNRNGEIIVEKMMDVNKFSQPYKQYQNVSFICNFFHKKREVGRFVEKIKLWHNEKIELILQLVVKM